VTNKATSGNSRKALIFLIEDDDVLTKGQKLTGRHLLNTLPLRNLPSFVSVDAMVEGFRLIWVGVTIKIQGDGKYTFKHLTPEGMLVCSGGPQEGRLPTAWRKAIAQCCEGRES